MTSASIGLSSNIIAKTMQTALTSNITVSDVIVYNSVVDNVIKSGLADTNTSSSSGGSKGNSGSSSGQRTTTDKINIQNLYESYVDNIGIMAMKAISKGQVLRSKLSLIIIIIINIRAI